MIREMLEAEEEQWPPPSLETIEGRFQVGNVKFDQRDGFGAVPDQSNVNYMGWTVFMTADEFLQLNPFRRGPLHPETAEKIKAGEPIASPWLDVEITMRGESPTLRTISHEGRGRAGVLKELLGSTPMPVNVFGRGEYNRARHLSKAIVEAPIFPDDRSEGKIVIPSKVLWSGG